LSLTFEIENTLLYKKLTALNT